jgi:predicted nucleic-acid-binding Zn-ribbon protein
MPNNKLVVSGVCPKCGAEDLHYDNRREIDNLQMWDFTCRQCGAEGYEEYTVKFLGTMVSGGFANDTYYDEGAEVDEPATKKGGQ